MFQIKYLLPLSAIFLTSIFSSCKKDTEFGMNILPTEDIIKPLTTDTVSIKMISCREEKYKISGVSRLFAGTYFDPVFGQTSASFALQFIPATNYDFKTLKVETDTTYDVADSIVLYLPYESCYGDSVRAQNINIYQLKERLDYSARYYSNKNPELIYNPEALLASATIIPQNIPKDSIFSTKDTTLVRRVSIKLPMVLAEDIIKLSPGTLNSSTSYKDFPDFFKGIYVKSANGTADESITKWHISDNTRIVMYYHTVTHGLVADSGVFIFSAANSYTAKMNFMKYEISNPSIIKQLDVSNTVEDSVSYIQSGNLRTKIIFPNIENYRTEKKISVTRAELIIKKQDIDSENERYYPILNTLYLFSINEDGSTDLMPDYMATFDTKRKEYRFDIANHITEVSIGKRNHYGFYLEAYNEKNPDSRSLNTFGRSILRTAKNSNPMKLVITYSTLD